MTLNVFDSAVRQLSSRLMSEVRRKIIYHRLVQIDPDPLIPKVDTSVPLEAWEGQTVFRSNSQTKSFLDWSGKDFLIIGAALQMNGVPIEPEKGDWIIRIDEYDNQTKYEVSAPAGEPVWRKSDTQGYIWRIHTKQSVF